VGSLIVQLARQSHEIDEKFLRRIGKIKLSRKRPESSSRGKNVQLATSPARELELPSPMLAVRSESGAEGARRRRASRAVATVLTKHGVRLDNPRMLSFAGKTVSFTGLFDFGIQADCVRATPAEPCRSAAGPKRTVR
jgi:hypothetical protein